METSSGRSADDGGDAVENAFKTLTQGFALSHVYLHNALTLSQQKLERMLQECQCKVQEALRLQDQRAAAALRQMEQKLREKDDAVHALQRRLEETQERTPAAEGSGGGGGLQRLEERVEEVEVSLQNFPPHAVAQLLQLEPTPTRSSLPTETCPSSPSPSAREAPAGGAAAGGGERASSSQTLFNLLTEPQFISAYLGTSREAPAAAAGGAEEPPPPEPFPASSCSSSSSSSNPGPSGANGQGAAAGEQERERRRVKARMRLVRSRMREARNAPCPLGEQLCEAAFVGQLTDVQRLIDSGANVNYTDQEGYTPLLKAVSWEASTDVVWLLLQRGADVNAIDCFGYSVLHWAAIRVRRGECVDLLVGAGGDVNARNKDGMTPLHFAAINVNERTVRVLLAAGARRDLTAWSKPCKGKTPFDVATSPEIKELLRL